MLTWFRHVSVAAALFSSGACDKLDHPPSSDGGVVADLQASDAVSDAAMRGDDLSPGDTRLLPFAVGYTWTFNVRDSGTNPNPCAVGDHVQKVESQQLLAGKNAFAISSYCTATTGLLYYALEANEVDTYWNSDGQWHLALDLTLQDGHSWSDGTGTLTWSKEQTVVVPAGTFTSCWRATKKVAYEAYTIYCPGAGAVHTHVKDTAKGIAWDNVLVAKNF